ncbi:MAG: hypothetical protein M1818_008154 [Claussenomyces sp. TS43310]|nr:MAG: hypothetical protein M1818_008154 [Claussenomyces sp. TS43310]
MFCTTLRKRQEWMTIVPFLLKSQSPRWTEKSLNTHDIAIPLSRPNDEGGFFRLLLLSALDLRASDQAMARIERLYHLNGSRLNGIIFLLNGTAPQEESMNAYMSLQANLLNSSFDIHVLPLFDTSSLSELVFTFHRQLLQNRVIPTPLQQASRILPYCSANRPLPEHTRHVISDIVPNLKELARAATTEDGQHLIRQWLMGSPAQADDVIDFWLQEYVVG